MVHCRLLDGADLLMITGQHTVEERIHLKFSDHGGHAFPVASGESVQYVGLLYAGWSTGISDYKSTLPPAIKYENCSEAKRWKISDLHT